MSNWNFKQEESTFKPIEVGAHRVRIASAERATSSNVENPHEMIVLKMDVSGHSGYLFYNLVFLEDRPEITNKNLTSIFRSFKDIKMGDLNEKNWVGKVGAVMVKHEEYPPNSGKVNAKVHYFIEQEKQGGLPAWKEPERKNDSDGDVPTDDDGFVSAMGAAESTQTPW